MHAVAKKAKLQLIGELMQRFDAKASVLAYLDDTYLLLPGRRSAGATRSLAVLFGRSGWDRA